MLKTIRLNRYFLNLICMYVCLCITCVGPKEQHLIGGKWDILSKEGRRENVHTLLFGENFPR